MKPTCGRCGVRTYDELCPELAPYLRCACWDTLTDEEARRSLQMGMFFAKVRAWVCNVFRRDRKKEA